MRKARGMAGRKGPPYDSPRQAGPQAGPPRRTLAAWGADGPPYDSVPAWEMIEPGRYKPLRTRGSFPGRELG